MIKLKFLSRGLVAMLLVVFLTSCGSSKDIVYFQNTDTVSDSMYTDLSNYEIKIMPNDNLLITVSALNPEAVEPFNTVNLSRGYSISGSTLELQGYLVDETGYINFPVIGKLSVAGLTKIEAVNLIQSKVSQYIDNATVNLRFLNYKVSVLGEVNRPGTYTVDSERISIPEALAKAGDMTIYGKRHDVLICRVEEGVKKFYHVDITSPDIFFSEVYYLQQNDIIYVLPNKSKVMSSTYNPMLATFISGAGLLVSITTLIISLSKK
ncbi:MAG: polysaccharide biosynthesis/export family protein [Candidatus Symbiothrix sp.]|jgi:polysaccharide export outer membrane protein|nr:polysaccharide biosynthesis/export family protein [Candidatus Symbiothrix sp.]